jgi:DNA-nicking Smr family endonuclease
VKLRTLGELHALRQALAAAHPDGAARHAAAERPDDALPDAEPSLFARSVGPVTTLSESSHARPLRPRPSPRPRQRELDEQAVLREALSDEIDVDSLLDTDEALSFRRPGIRPEVVRKLRRGHWSIQAHIDLHGLRRDEAREQLGAFLRAAVIGRLRCVRVVHGKGNGSPGREPVLKGKVRGWLVQRSEVIAFVQARASDGGSGALVVLLGKV